MARSKSGQMQELPWNFEAFRRYLPYEKMQQAASVLAFYEGERLDSSNPNMHSILDDLQLRTGEPWLPERKVSESVDFNVEGDFYRNKGRLLTSFYIIQPKQLVAGPEASIQMTEFGRALANGYVSQQEFYRFIVTQFEYPHPAYDDNWDAWKRAGRFLKPLAFILKILVRIYENDETQNHITSEELATFAYPVSDYRKVDEIVKQIGHNRKKPGPSRPRSDEVNRKISDMLGFLCVAGFCFYENRKVSLNLMRVHPQEMAYYWEKRKTSEYEEANALGEIKDLLLKAGV